MQFAQWLCRSVLLSQSAIGNTLSVTVIIPTTCELRRKASLLRAIESIVEQDVEDVEVIVVVNGNRFDAELLAQIQADARLRVYYQELGSLPAAIRFGRSLVRSEFYAFLDDDDEYLPGAIRTRLAPLLANANVDLVVTNGFYHSNSDHQLLKHASDVNINCLAALIEENWLASCGGLFRSSAITLDYFEGSTKYYEWTLLAFRIALAGHIVALVDTPTFRINNTPESESKSDESARSLIPFIQGLLTYPAPTHIRHALRRKLSAAWHTLAEKHRGAGRRRDAWRCHARSLLLPGGWRFLGYTRHLLFGPRRVGNI
jgi:hypothetical protein